MTVQYGLTSHSTHFAYIFSTEGQRLVNEVKGQSHQAQLTKR